MRGLEIFCQQNKETVQPRKPHSGYGAHLPPRDQYEGDVLEKSLLVAHEIHKKIESKVFARTPPNFFLRRTSDRLSPENCDPVFDPRRLPVLVLCWFSAEKTQLNANAIPESSDSSCSCLKAVAACHPRICP